MIVGCSPLHLLWILQQCVLYYHDVPYHLRYNHQVCLAFPRVLWWCMVSLGGLGENLCAICCNSSVKDVKRISIILSIKIIYCF